MDDLLTVLGNERSALGHLLFRLVETRGLLATGESRFLHLAARDVEAAAAAVREVELNRALLPSLADGRTLQELAAAAPPPLDEILDDHRVAIGRLAAEIGAILEATTELAEHGLAEVRQRSLKGVPAAPRRSRSPAAFDELDREILVAGYETVLNASARLMLPSLVAFLG